MSNLVYAKSFRDLFVYQKSRELTNDIYKLSKMFPREETFSLTDQIRRSSRSIGANIAEAWAKRKYERHFVSKLTDADGEQMETQHWLGVALDCSYITKQIEQAFVERYLEIGRMLGGMMEKADLFCGDTLRISREPTSEYFVVAPIDDTVETDD